MEQHTDLCQSHLPTNEPPKQTSFKRIFFYLIVVIFASVYLWIGCQISLDKAAMFRNESGIQSLAVKVVDIIHDRNDMGEIGGMVYYERVITFDAEVLKGERKGEIIRGRQTIDNLTSNGTLPIEKGDKIFLYPSVPGTDVEWEAGDFYRSNGILFLGIIFLLGILIFGRSKGVKTILSLVFTCLAIFIVFIPAILAGYNAYLVSIITCLYIIVVTLALIGGPEKKSVASALGCAGGVMIAGILSVIMDHMLKLTGYLDDQSMYVSLLNESNPIDLKAIIFASIIIGAMGATMDVSMDISASLFEIHRKIPDISFGHLVHSGFTIGRDIMGTMANTLILAYIGSSLTTVLLFASYQASLEQLFNRELIIVELLQALCGSIGILCTIPISALIASALCCHNKTHENV